VRSFAQCLSDRVLLREQHPVRIWPIPSFFFLSAARQPSIEACRWQDRGEKITGFWFRWSAKFIKSKRSRLAVLWRASPMDWGISLPQWLWLWHRDSGGKSGSGSRCGCGSGSRCGCGSGSRCGCGGASRCGCGGASRCGCGGESGSG